MFDNFDIDINLNEIWVEVRQLYQILAKIGLEWTDKNNNTHSVSFISLFFGAWLVFEIMAVFFKFDWNNKDEARADVWDD